MKVSCLPMRGLCLGLLVLLCGCSRPPDPRESVLLITVDSLRADRLGASGYARDTTPALDALAAEGVRFRRAYSHAPFTPPAHASLLTGLCVQSHGVLGWTESLAPGARTLGERLGAAGWRTGAFYNHPGLRASQVTRGFETVEERCFEEVDRTAGAFLRWVDQDREAPFCAWLHLWDVHRPYGFRDWREDWARARVERDELTLPFAETGFGPRHDRRVGRDEGYYNLTPAERARPRPVGDATRRLTESDFRYLEDRYDDGVAYLDAGLGRLFEALRQRGLMERTLIVVTADHGESLRERDAVWFTHDPFLYEETLHVPLILRFPDRAYAGRAPSELVRHIDVLPTVLDCLGVAPRGDEQGRSLLPLLEGRALPPATLLAETRTKSAKEREARAAPGQWLEERLALSDGHWKVVRDRTAGSWSLFDLEQDPGETHDLAPDPAYADELARRSAELEHALELLPRAEPRAEEASEELLRLLNGTGYAGD